MIRASVIQEDIDHEQGRTCGSCPVALAVKRATGKSGVYVYVTEIVIGESFQDSAIYRTPGVASAFIRKFDSAYGLTVNQAILDQCKPFDFVLTEQDRIR